LRVAPAPLNLTASEALSSLGGTITSGTTSLTLGETTATGNVHTLTAQLPGTAPAGAWTMSLSAKDLAGNDSGAVAGPGFNVRAPIGAASLTLDKTAVTTGGVVNITITLAAGTVIAGKPTVTVGLSGTAGTALTNVAGSGTTFTASYTVAASPADPDGQYV